MEHHRLDPLSLVFGALFVVIGLAVVFGWSPAWPARLHWLGPVAVVAAGVWLLAAARGRSDDASG